MKLIDSHCHLHLMDLNPFNNQVVQVLKQAAEKGVTHFLCVSVKLDEYDQLCEIAKQNPEVLISVGVHPNYALETEPTVEQLCEMANLPACIAIGETGLDYLRITHENEKDIQRARYVTHIRAAIAMKKPLIIHTRQAAEDTISLLKAENAKQIGGVMHCFTESWEIAQQALDLGFYISFSGIVTFKNAQALQDVAKRVPLDRILIETDSPYLAPVPFRKEQNQPAYVYHVAEKIAELRNETLDRIAEITTENFSHCFKVSLP